MIFNLNKFQAIHFSYKKAFSNLDIGLPFFILPRYNISKQIVKSVEKKVSICQPGVFYNSRFFFKDHAKKLASKRQEGALGLKILIKMAVKMAQGVNAVIMYRVIYIYIFFILIYIVPVWQPGYIQINKKE